MQKSFRQIINKAVADKRFLVVPGAHDALSARLIQQIGFETYFIGGFPAVGARYGVPDVGLKGFGEIAAAVRDIASHRDELRALCRRFHVRRLDGFGSAARGDFDPAQSDLDFLVEFDSREPEALS